MGFQPLTSCQGHSLERVRTDTITLMAEYDEASAVNTARPLGTVNGDAYSARSAEIDAHKGKRRA
jgi:hypothetical protein